MASHTSQNVTRMPLGEFLTSSISTLINNQEAIMERLERLEQRQLKVEERLAEIKTALHSSGIIKSTAQKTTRTVVEKDVGNKDQPPVK